jgi:mannose/fructose/N-acetylgalactosamine-specific phosphotransferase system component IID
MSSNVRYINERERYTNGRTIRETVNEAKQEFKQFAETRLAMLQAELREKIEAIKASAPLLAVGALIAITAFFVLTAALICVVYVAFAGSAYAPFLACLIVGVVYAIIGITLLLLGYKGISKQSLVPHRTIKVLKEDSEWLKQEARTQL